VVDQCNHFHCRVKVVPVAFLTQQAVETGTIDAVAALGDSPEDAGQLIGGILFVAVGDGRLGLVMDGLPHVQFSCIIVLLHEGEGILGGVKRHPLLLLVHLIFK
jgi:hypothetical protein